MATNPPAALEFGGHYADQSFVTPRGAAMHYVDAGPRCDEIVLLVRTRAPITLSDLVQTELQAMPEVLANRTELLFDELATAAATN